MTKPQPDRDAYTVAEIAGRLGVTTSYIYKIIDQGHLRCIRIGRKVLVPAAAYHKLIEDKAAS